MLSCDEGSVIGSPISLLSATDYGSLEHCKQSCDLLMPECRSFSYSANDQSCTLHSAGGAPQRFW